MKNKFNIAAIAAIATAALALVGCATDPSTFAQTDDSSSVTIETVPVVVPEQEVVVVNPVAQERTTISEARPVPAVHIPRPVMPRPMFVVPQMPRRPF